MERRTLLACAAVLLLMCLYSEAEGLARTPPQNPGSDQMAGMPGMGQSAGPAAVPQPWCVDSAWSTFNHRAAGWFLLFWGLTALIAGLERPKLTAWRFAPPLILFGLAEFLFFRNDPEAWPTGPMSFLDSLRNPEDLQHRIFLLLVVLIAVVELRRAAGRLSPVMSRYALPALGAFGAVYLFFHKHGGSEMAALMNGSQADPGMRQMMASMSLVRHEHLWFSIFGFGLVAAKLLADTGHLKGRWGSSAWTVFAVLLGGYMIGYVE